MQRYTIRREVNVRQVQEWTVETEDDLAALLEEHPGLADELVCNNGNLDHEDHDPVGDDDLQLTITKTEEVE